MFKYFLTGLTLLTTISVHSAENWFEGSSPLIKAHQTLLDDNLEESFASMVQVWQSTSDDYMKAHLNQLFLQSLSKDCGKSFSSEPLADWLSDIVIRKQSIESPGRRSEQLVIEAVSDAVISEITFERWPNIPVSDETEFSVINDTESQTIHRNRFSLARKLGIGLYKVSVNSPMKGIWESWVIIGEADAKEVVRWESKDRWTVDKFGLLNPYCALPVMDVALYDYVDEAYSQVWKRSYESDYPETLPKGNYKAERYVLAVSITLKRWQGAITVEERQIISKTHDISEE